MAIKKNTNCQEVETATFFETIRGRILQRIHKWLFGLKRKRPAANSKPHPCWSLAICGVLVIEEQNHSDGVPTMVLTFRDIRPRDSGRLLACAVRGDKSDKRSQVGTFYVKNNQVNDPQESGFWSMVGVTGSVPPLTHTAHSSVAQKTVKEESRSLSGEVDVSEDLEGGKKLFSLQGSKTLGQDYDSCSVNPRAPDDETSATTHDGSSNGKELCIPEDNTATSNSEKDGFVHVVDSFSSASAVEKYGAVSDDETDGPIFHLQGGVEDSVLGFPTPASLSDADSQNIRYVSSSATSGFSEAPFPPPSHTPQYCSPSTQQPTPPHPHTRNSPVRLQHKNNNTEVVQSISYTTNSFKKPINTTETAKEEHSRTTACVNPISKQGITSPKHDGALPTTLSTHHQHLLEATEVQDGSAGKGAVTITTRAVPETAEGKKDSQCLIADPALLPAAMKAELIVPSSIR